MTNLKRWKTTVIGCSFGTRFLGQLQSLAKKNHCNSLAIPEYTQLKIPLVTVFVFLCADLGLASSHICKGIHGNASSHAERKHSC